MILSSAEDVQNFTFGGKAILTIQSLKTQKHFTYKIRKSKWQGRAEAYFVFVLIDEGQYAYLGMITTTRELVTTSRSNYSIDTPCFQAFRYFLRAVIRENTIPSMLVVRHNGKCACCALPLTHPDSIDKGIGPECRKKLSCN